MDLKNNHSGSNVASGIGLNDFGPTTQSWPKNAMLPDISFASNALRASPSNKIDIDDTNYATRWLGHINRNTMFVTDNSNTYINEWYYDTASIKKPANAQSDNVRSPLGYQSDYAKINEIGTPWGHNWFSANYLNGYHDNNEISALSKFEECDFWEREGYVNSSGDTVQKEIGNSNDIYNISSGNAMLIKDNYDNGTGSQYRDHTITFQKYTPYPANGTDGDGVNPAYSGYENSINRYGRLAESNFKRTYSLIATLSSSVEIFSNYFFTKINNNFWPGQLVLTVRKSDDKKLLSKVLEIIKFPDANPSYQKVIVDWASGQDGTASGAQNWPNSFDYGDEVYDASRMKYTKPNAYSDLLRNNSGKGYLGAYIFSQNNDNTPLNTGKVGRMAWEGFNGPSWLSKKRGVVKLTYASSSEEEAGAWGHAITSITRSNDTITVTTYTAHGLNSGDGVIISGSNAYSNTASSEGFPVNKISSTQFSVFNDGNVHSSYSGRAYSDDLADGSTPGTETYSGTNYAVWFRRLKGLPSTVITKDESLDGQNFIYHNSVQTGQLQYDLHANSNIKHILKPDTDYYVTYTCRNFHSQAGTNTRFRLTLGQSHYDTAFKARIDDGTLDTREYHDITGNAYKTTVVLKTPSFISEDNSYKILNISTIHDGDLGLHNTSVGTIGTTTSNSATTRGDRTMLGDFSVAPVLYFYGKTNMDVGYPTLERKSVSTTKVYNFPSSFLSIGYQKYRNLTSNWSVNAKAYDFYISYLFDGGQTPQESTPKFMKKLSVDENSSGGLSFRFSVSLCYSSLGNVLDMFNKRMTGARVYFKESELQESTKLYALLDIDFTKGVRKASNENFVPWAPDSQDVMHYSDVSPTESFNSAEELGVYDLPGSRPYSQVKPANEGSHVYGYFNFEAPPTVLEWGTLNSSNPFEKGDFYAQYKTSTLLKGKRYIGNLSIRPNGINESKDIASKVYENYPNSIIASEEGCYDKFPYETGWVNLPIDTESSPIVKLESYLDFLIIHKELSTHVLNFKQEDKPALVASLSTIGIKWKCQSIVTNVGAFWINASGCYHFDGEKITNLIKGKISQDSLGWPNNKTNLYYWDIKGDNLHIPSIGYDEINSQILVIANSRVKEHEDNNTNNLQKDSHVWIYDLESKAWTTDSCVTSNNDSHFLKPYHAVKSGYRSNIVNESGNNPIFLEKHWLLDPANLIKWSNSLYKYTEADGTIKGDTRKFEFQTKQIDFGNPHTQKRIHQIYVTYRLNTASIPSDGTGGGTGNIDTNVEYSTDGGGYSGNFDTSTSENFGSSFSNSSGNWAIASLVPNTAIDCYTFALKVSSGAQEVPFDFEINDITFVYRSKRIKTKARN